MDVVVVESPAKAKTIEKYLGSDFKVLASYGHICDLPSKDGSVRPDEDFAMDYVTDTKSAKHLKAIVDASKKVATAAPSDIHARGCGVRASRCATGESYSRMSRI